MEEDTSKGLDAIVQTNLVLSDTLLKRKPNCFVLQIPRKLLWIGAILTALLSVAMSANFIMDWLGPRFGVPPQVMKDLGVSGVILFRQHDRDDDGYLSLEEFEPLGHRLIQINETFNYDKPIDDWDEVVTVDVKFQPILLDTMTKEVDKEIYGPIDGLNGLKTWTKPIYPWRNFGASHFKAFLPQDPYLLDSVGTVYELVENMGHYKTQSVTLSSNLYLPPELSGDGEKIVHRLVCLFHPRPFIYTRFAPQGSVAMVRAHNDKYVEIVFRIHAEFQLNEPPFHPFWFTPAQFAGRLIMSKDGTKLLHFNMMVPTNNKLNVDMEWLNGPRETENMEVDIGFMPQMELEATRSSVQVMHEGVDVRDSYVNKLDYDPLVDNITWKEEIPVAKALRDLEVALYPFKKVEYHNFSTVFSRAEAEKKLVHSIILWGALDDQSC